MKKVLFGIVSLLTLLSCAKEKFIAKDGGETVTFAACFDETDKTILDGLAVNWLKDDPISIFDGSTPVTATASNDGASANFSAKLSSSGPWYALFPSNSDATIKNDVVTTEVLSEITSKDNTFAKKVNVAIAQSDSKNKLVFKNTLSYIKFTVGQAGIAKIAIKGNSGEEITGTVQIKYNSGAPQTTVVADACTTSSLIPYDRADFKTGINYYIGFVPTAFSAGFTLVYTDVYGDTHEVKKADAVTFKRSKIYNVGTPDSKFTVDSEIKFEDADVKADIVAAFGSGGKIKKSQAAAVTFAQFQAFKFTSKSTVNKFNELKYFTGLYANPVPGESRTGYIVPDAFFSGYTNLQEVTLPANVTEIRPRTFQGCSSLSSIVIPSGVAGIYKSAFRNAGLACDLVIPEGVKTVSDSAFANCTKLTAISLPSTLTKVNKYAFWNCTNVKGTVKLPESLTDITQYSFYGLQNVSKIILPKKPAAIGLQAFWALRAATSVGPEGTPEGETVIPGTVTSLPQMSFCDEYYIHTLRIEEGVTTLGDRSFRKFGISVADGTPIVGYIPSSVTTIADKTFQSSDFDYVIFASATPATISGNPFENATHFSDGTLKLYVPSSAVTAYKAAWTKLKDNIYSIDEFAGNFEVKGGNIDIRSLYDAEQMVTETGETLSVKAVYPQNVNYTVSSAMVSAAGNAKEFAVSLHKYSGPKLVRTYDSGVKPRVAVAASSLSGWTDTGASFTVGSATYHVFTKNDYKTGEWQEIPDVGDYSAIVFGETVKVAGFTEYGKILAKSKGKIREYNLSNVCMAILPDGSYIAGCTGSEFGKNITFLKSTDKGATWAKYGNFDKATNLIGNYPTLFVVGDKLYLMGTGSENASIRICRSDDGGLTWTIADSVDSGILFTETTAASTNVFHAAPGAAVVEFDGRVYAAWEEYVSWNKKYQFMISCPTDLNLLKQTNWTKTNVVTSQKDCEEGNAVVYNGSVYNLIRLNETEDTGHARLMKMNSTTNLTDMKTVNLPGGGKKFKIVYDAKGKKFWTFTCPETYKSMSQWPKHDGIYSSIGVTCSLQRNKLYLLSSTDLENWTVVKNDVFTNDDFFFHGFQYVDFCIDGDDLVAVMRLAAQESRGLPYRQHDANQLSFFKIENFRNL